MFATISRESALVFNNILLAVACFVVFVGTIWPLVAEMLFDRKLSVGPPFFNMAFTPFMVALGLILPLGSVLPWKRAGLSRAMAPLWPWLALSVALMALVWAMQTGRSALGPVGVMLGAWMVGGAISELWVRSGKGGTRLRRLAGLPRADWGKAVAHMGLGITFIGVAGLMAWQTEDIRVAQIGDRYPVGSGYEVELRDVRQVQGPNYLSTMAEIAVWRGDRLIDVLDPEKRFYPVAQMPTTEAAIKNGFLRDVYVVIGDPQEAGGWAVRTFIKPLANWIWAGAIIMSLGGFLSLSDRRYRVAAGARKGRPAGPAPVPAE